MHPPPSSYCLDDTDDYSRPDNCDGTFEATCDSKRQYTNIEELMGASPDTLAYMKKYWKDYQGNDESFWEHEWGKHGTCISTLNPECYADYKTGVDAVDFFDKTVELFKSLPSYEWLTAAGITPSTSATYTLDQIQSALSSKHGADVVINCDGSNLNELWYQYNVQGSIQSGKFVASAPVGSGSTCPKTGIKWIPKSGGGGTNPPNTTTTGTGSPPTGTPGGSPSGKGTLKVKSGSSTAGFIISSGKWYNGGGTAAGFTATPSGSSFTLSSSKGKCAVQNSALTCASTVTSATAFGYDGTYLTHDQSNTFYADSVPSGTTQGSVYTASKGVSLQISWSPS